MCAEKYLVGYNYGMGSKSTGEISSGNGNYKWMIIIGYLFAILGSVLGFIFAIYLKIGVRSSQS